MSLRCRAIVVAIATLFWTAPAGAIVGGTEDHGSLSRATVMVLSSKGGVCSAVIVARDAVLTAGHCVSGAPEHRVHFRGPDGQPVLIEPAAKAVHPGYEAKAVEARRRSIDLAMLRLPEPLPARFDVATLSAAPARAGAMLHVGGYGVAREGDHRSTGTFRIARIPAVEPHGPSRILVWAAAPQGAAGLCVGDSGGPIARDNSSSVFAVAAWASGSRASKCGGTSQGILLGPRAPGSTRPSRHGEAERAGSDASRADAATPAPGSMRPSPHGEAERAGSDASHADAVRPAPGSMRRLPHGQAERAE